MTQLIQPQEVEVFYILPAIRHSLTRRMKAFGYSQKKIAELLSIRESTVSQYCSDKRGVRIQFTPGVEEELAKSAVQITSRSDLIRETQRLLQIIRQSGKLCEVHKQLADLGDGCTIDSMRCG